MKVRILWIGLFVTSLLHSQWMRPGLPDLTWVFLIPLALHPLRIPGILGLLLAGVLKDGTQPNMVWLSPLLFVLTGWLGQVARETLNMKWIVAKALFATVVILIAFLVLLLIYGTGLWPLLLRTAGWSLVLSLLSVIFLT